MGNNQVKTANPFQFKTIQQNVYFRPNEDCHWALYCTGFTDFDAKTICNALQFSTEDFSISYQFHADMLTPK